MKMLKRVRDEIDRLDSEIAALLMRRLEMASVAGRLKKDVLDRAREREVLAKVAEMTGPHLGGLVGDGIYTAIFDTSRGIQSSGMKLGGFPSAAGERGETAVHMYDPKALPVLFDDERFMLELCAAGCLDFAVVPVGGISIRTGSGLDVAATFAKKDKSRAKDCAGFAVVVASAAQSDEKKPARGRRASKA
jgi:chorismate mutase